METVGIRELRQNASQVVAKVAAGEVITITDRTYLVDGLLRNIHEQEIPLFVNADVTKINETDGKVTGVNVKINGEEKEIAGDAVVVTTGGFGSNKELIEKYRPDLKAMFIGSDVQVVPEKAECQ